MQNIDLCRTRMGGGFIRIQIRLNERAVVLMMLFHENLSDFVITSTIFTKFFLFLFSQHD